MTETHNQTLMGALFDQPGLSECIIPDILQVHIMALMERRMDIVAKNFMGCYQTMVEVGYPKWLATILLLVF